tara:strand:+ start:1210 stop:2475 length:1266 start_codon:yes stop_codon:yes gene_type:complete
MSKYLVEENSESSILLFNKRRLYRSILRGQNHNNIIQMDVAEKILYGRIDSNFLPLIVTKANLTRLQSFDNEFDPPKALNFVADLFAEVVTQFKKCTQIGNIRQNDTYLSNLKAYKAYVDPIEEYQQYIQTYSDSIAGMFIADNIKVTNFDEFKEAILPVLKTAASFEPITFTGFLKSKNCSVLSTGLAIEIADSDYINDNEKFESFIQSENWEFFVNTCDSYGFMVDLNVPWRMIIDLNSTAAIEAASRYIDVATADQTLFYYYQNSSRVNYSFFKKTLLDLYMNIRKNYAQIFECQVSRKLVPSVISAQAYTLEQLTKKYDEQYFIDFYTRLRLFEERRELDSEKINKIVDDQISFFNSNGDYERLFVYLESQINKTFDKEGSLGYYNNLYRKRKIEKFNLGEINILTTTEGGDDFSGY